MAKLAANLTWLFTELPFAERFGAAARAGFKAVEMLFPYELSAARVRELLDEHGLQLVLFNLPPGDWDAGDRGLAGVPGREAEFDDAVARARDYARTCACPRVHAMAGRIPQGVPIDACTQTYVSNLRRAADAFARDGVTVLIEPLNAVENPTYLLQSTAQALAVIERVAAPNLAIQLDIYHLQISEGDLERRIRALRGRFSHVQIASNPHRNEPDTGEVDYRYVLRVLDDGGYDGWIGCEYKPRAGTLAGLGWAAEHGIA